MIVTELKKDELSVRIPVEILSQCLILTNHEERHCEVLSARGLHSSKDRAHNCTANAHKCNHDDEPADADGLRDGDAAAGLDLLTVVRETCLLVLVLHIIVTGPEMEIILAPGNLRE